MKAQAESFGAEIRSNIKITEMNISGAEKIVVVNNKERYSSKAVVLAPGGSSRTLNVPGEDTFKGRGISYCATCDGDFFQDKEIIVVGGGNAALEEAVSLTTYASKVTIVHQFDNWQAFASAVKEMEENPKIDTIMESRIVEFKGDMSLQEVVIEHIPTGERYTKKIDGTFIFIGYVPNTEELKGVVELNKWNEIVVDDKLMTSVDGVFAAGDSIAKRYRQITTAVADGTVAALNVLEFLNDKE
jgi:thioredoxin reductase (NADPH)